MKTKKHIAIFSTGGTILCQYVPAKKIVVPALKGEELVRRVPGLGDWVTVSVLETFQLPGPHLTVNHALQLSAEIEKILENDEYDGAVVLQGTDTLEEISYAVHLTLKSNKPVVFTGAMKSDGEAYSDALGNIEASLRVACSPNSSNKGVLVVMNQEIHSAVDVMKTDSENIKAFSSPQSGPLGRVSLDQVIYFAHNERAANEHGIYQRRVVNSVVLLKAYVGIDPQLVRFVHAAKMKGLVIEAFGAGNLPPEIAREAKILIEEGISVVIATRCVTGRSYPYYDYEGGGKQLQKSGFLFAGNICGVKCRLKLMLTLGNGLKPSGQFEQEM